MQNERSNQLSAPWLRSPAFWSGVAGAVFYLWLVNIFSLHLLAYAGADDGLFLRLASSLARAKWLGRYDEYTLIKGLGYPAFIALVYRLGLPLLLAQHLLYVFACALFCYAVRGLLERAGLRLLLFLALLFSYGSAYLAAVVGVIIADTVAIAFFAACLLAARSGQ